MKIDVQGESVYCYTNNRDIDPRRDTIVFVHGAGMDHTVWTLFARHFARHGRNVISVDLPGHGRSGGEPLVSIEAMADWLAAVLDEMGIERAAVTGHSLGSLVALDFAARYPDRTSALVMIGTTAPMPVSDAILDASAANDHSAFDMLTEYGYSKRHLYGGNSNPGMWMVGSTLRLFERSRPGVLHADMNACNQYLQGLQRAADVSCPVLLVLGRGDRLTPVRGTIPLQEALPDPRVVVLEASGHTLMTEAPNALLDALRDFLQAHRALA
jgi:pimeloyl-ACP methyl ester carboxylesterase